MLVRRLIGALFVTLGTIGLMAIGLKAMKPRDYVFIYDAKTSTKYRVKREDYNRNVKKEQKRFERRREEMLRRNQGYIPENEMRMQRMDNGTFARYRKGRSPRE